MTRKKRLTVTVDPHLIEAGGQAVASGLAESMSAWVNSALAAHMERDRRLRSLAEAVASFEQEHGAISAEEIAAQQRADRTTAVVVRRPRAHAASPAPTGDCRMGSA